jgi:hypothetical protein
LAGAALIVGAVVVTARHEGGGAAPQEADVSEVAEGERRAA